ncbi:MAG: glycosyltransferase [Acidobacteria bacterium]|nr:glycosyltransferase [Acidobacteriota bacterium]
MTRLRELSINAYLLTRTLANPLGRLVLRDCFDSEFYYARYPDVQRSHWPAFLHYAWAGYKEYRDPSPAFSTAFYFRHSPDVFRQMICPLLHYAALGREEGRPVAAAEAFERDRPAGDDVQNAWPADAPLVSVVIPCFNYGHYLKEALASVESQTFTDVEVIVVEGGSSDAGSVEEVREMERSGRFRATFLYRRQACAAGDNRNFGMARARGKYICCLDADDRLLPSYLEVAAFTAEMGDYDVVSPSLRRFGDAQGTWYCRVPTLAELARTNTLASASLFRREMWEQLGGFRDLGSGSDHLPEDWDFWLRAVAAGYLVRALPTPLYEYRVHSGSLTARSKPSRYEAGIVEANKGVLAHPVTPRKQARPAPQGVEMIRREAAPEQPGILLCLPWITRGGAERLLLSLFGPLAAGGAPVLAVTTAHLLPLMQDDSEAFQRAGIRVFALPELFPDGSLWQDFLISLVRRHHVGRLMICGSQYGYEQLPQLRAEYPRLLVYDQLFNEVGHLTSNRRFAGEIDLTLVPSEFLRRILTDDCGEHAARVRVLRHGLLPAPAATGDAGDELPSLGHGRFLVAFAGRLSAEKAPGVFVEVAAALSTDPRFAFMMVGDGPERDAVECAILKHGLADRMLMCGMVANLRPYLQQTQALVVPSVMDGMPNVILEAMEAGVPVVASRVGGIPEMIRTESSGFLCTAGSVAEFAAAIRRLADSPELRARISAEARRTVTEEFDFEQTAAAYRGLFGVGPSEDR